MSWEESSEYQERKNAARLARQENRDRPSPVVPVSVPATTITPEHGVRDAYRPPTHARGEVWKPAKPGPVQCPECGLVAEERRREAHGVYFVDLVCPFCDWRDLDGDGGV